MTDAPIKHRKRKNLAKAKEEYAGLEKAALEGKYKALVKFLLMQEWSPLMDGKSVQGTPYSEDDYLLVTEKLRLCEDEFERRYPNTYTSQLNWLYEQAKIEIENQV